MTFRKELFTFIHPSSSHAVQPPPPQPKPLLYPYCSPLFPASNQSNTHPSPYHNFNPTCTIQHVIQSPQSLLPQTRKHALPSTSRPNPLPQHHSQNVPFLIYHDNPPHSYSSSKIHRSSRTLTFNPQSLIHIFFWLRNSVFNYVSKVIARGLNKNQYPV